MSLRVVVAHSAQAQLDELAQWWHTNRPASATDVKTEFRRVIELLAESPFLGRPYRRRRERNVRHFPLAGTPYQVFYAPKPDAGELRVLAVWSAERGEGPPL